MKVRKNLLKILILFILTGSIANTKTLKPVGEYYFKDKNNAYFNTKKINENVDLETFTYLDYCER